MKNLKQFNTFNLDVNCHKIVFLNSDEDYINFQKTSSPKILIGGGSDILFTCDYHGIVGITQNKGIEIAEDDSVYRVKAEAGTKWHELVENLVNRGIGGAENLALIPGTCGAAPIQNIGAYGLEFDSLCDYVNVVDKNGNKIKLKASDCNFGYRTSNFKTLWIDNYIITSIGLKLSKKWVPLLDYSPLKNLKKIPNLTPKLIFDEIIKLRMNKLPDPKYLGNAGSFFKNPVVSYEQFCKLRTQYNDMPYYEQPHNQFKIPAGWMIDRCNLKGVTIGGAQVYEHQALVIVNKGNAIPSDIIKLAKHITKTVEQKFNIRIEPEIRIYGSNGEVTLEQL